MKWSPQAKQASNSLKAEFAENVTKISIALAVHDQAAQVSPAHVHRAFQSLSMSGMSRVRWLDRPESLSSAGAFLIGVAFACPDIVATVVSDPNKTIARVMFGVSLCIGVFLFAYGWYRSRLPAIPSESLATERAKKIGRWFATIACVGILGYMLYAKLVIGLNDKHEHRPPTDELEIETPRQVIRPTDQG